MTVSAGMADDRSRGLPRVSMIAAMASSNRAIGVENRLPWNIPEDLKRFRAITTGHPVVMGRKTYESIGRLLPKRPNIIITRQKDFMVEGAIIAHSLGEALEIAAKSETSPSPEIFVIGGAEIYKLALPQADRLYMTFVDQRIEGDAFFPEWSNTQFKEIERIECEGYRFVTLDRLRK
jgi:dihydrofolate reductase